LALGEKAAALAKTLPQAARRARSGALAMMLPIMAAYLSECS
jgi:hypothetical protein